MIVASFIIKDLLIDWQKAEKFYSRNLVDYSIAVNNGNWQWVAGTSPSSNPYFRVFNPWEQSKKYDPDCKYIKKYIPELKDVPPKDIHKWSEKYPDYPKIKYQKPIIDHDKRKEIYIKELKKIK
jgi:deoxyribodipyrimidine photo-lyase